MNEFRLFAHGVEFNPDDYRAFAPVKFDGAWHKGEAGGDHPKTSGVFKILGDGCAIPIFEQQRIAVDYLSDNRASLKNLAKQPGVTTFILGLQYHIRLEINTSGFCMGPSAELMWLCLDIGIEPTYYVTLDEDWAERLRNDKDWS